MNLKIDIKPMRFNFRSTKLVCIKIKFYLINLITKIHRSSMNYKTILSVNLCMIYVYYKWINYCNLYKIIIINIITWWWSSIPKAKCLSFELHQNCEMWLTWVYPVHIKRDTSELRIKINLTYISISKEKCRGKREFEEHID